MKKPLITDQLLENSEPTVHASPPESTDANTCENLDIAGDIQGDSGWTEEPGTPIPEELEAEVCDAYTDVDGSVASESPASQKELTPTELAIQKRTGFWEVNIDKDDAKWIKNACQGKFEFAGPNEAFMLMNCYIGFTGALSRMNMPSAPSSDGLSAPTANNCVLQAAAIEACAFFINRYKGSGLDQAQRSFRITMALNPVIMQMRSLDEQIDAMRKSEQQTEEEFKITN